MARGQDKTAKTANQTAMPRFVDIKLTAEQRVDFMDTSYTDGEILRSMQTLADDGYRVGVSWAGEQQAYTVSLTCRDAGNENNGLCMTSFAKELRVALALMLYKHYEVAKMRWIAAAGGPAEDFG